MSRQREAVTELPAKEQLDIDGFLVTKDVVNLVRLSKRQIDRLIAKKKFPKADVPGLNGSPSRWRRSTIRRALDEMQAAAQAHQ